MKLIKKNIILFITMIAIIALFAGCDSSITDAYLKVTESYREESPQGPFSSDTSIVINARDFKTKEVLKNTKVNLVIPGGKIISRKTDENGYAYFIFKNGIKEGDYTVDASLTVNDVPYFHHSQFYFASGYKSVITLYLIKGTLGR